MQDTSLAAFYSVDHSSLLNRVLTQLSLSTNGYTCDELEQVLNGKHQSVSASLTRAKKQGLIADTGKRRNTRSGRAAIVWDITTNRGKLNDINDESSHNRKLL